jgi:hypothetical protein
MAFDINLSYNVLTQLSHTEISNVASSPISNKPHALMNLDIFLEFHTQTYYTYALNITPHHITKTQSPT